jgi:hypothetical protein
MKVRDNIQLLSVILTIHYIIFCFTGGPVWFSRLLKVDRQFYFEKSAKICDWLTTKNENSVVVVSEFYANADFYYKFLFLKVRDNAQLLSVISTIHYIIFCFTCGPVWFSRLLKVAGLFAAQTRESTPLLPSSTEEPLCDDRHFYFEKSAKICDWLTTKNENYVVVVRRESRSDSLVCCVNREFCANPDFLLRK